MDKVPSYRNVSKQPLHINSAIQSIERLQLEDIARRKRRSLVLNSHKIEGRIINGHSEPGDTGNRQNSLEKPNRSCEAEEPLCRERRWWKVQRSCGDEIGE